MEVTSVVLSALLVSLLASVSGDTTLSDKCLGCICQASTKCQRDIGCSGNFCGPLLISWSYWADAGKYVITGTHPDASNAYPDCANDLYCAGETVKGYMRKYGKDCTGDGQITCEDYARIHKLGPYSCDSPTFNQTQYYTQWRECSASVNP